MDVSRAQVSVMPPDRAVLVDPAAAFDVEVEMDLFADRPSPRSVTVRARGSAVVTSAVLAEVPVRQIAGVVASALRGEPEAQYRMLAIPRSPGERSWPVDHFERVARVAAWARRTGRQGGAAGAVSEFWGVHYRTARRWIAHRR